MSATFTSSRDSSVTFKLEDVVELHPWHAVPAVTIRDWFTDETRLVHVSKDTFNEVVNAMLDQIFTSRRWTELDNSAACIYNADSVGAYDECPF